MQRNENVINVYDMGREVQMSFYGGPDDYEPSVCLDTLCLTAVEILRN